MTLHSFSRTELIIGTENLNKLKKSKVAVFGIGGVGTFAVEGLARSGIEHFVLIDSDDVDITNINRQIHAFRNTVGEPKVELMKKRILNINPIANVKTHKLLYNSDTSEGLLSQDYDYVVDAIDMVSAKLDLIEKCTKREINIVSSMGAGNKIDPTKFEVTDIFKTSICPLAKVIRKELRKRGVERLKVVYSKEEPIKPKNLNLEYENTRKNSPGSMSFVPSVAGLIIASVVVRDLIDM